METLEEHQEMLRATGEKKQKEKESDLGEYCQSLSLMLKAEQQEASLRKYHRNIRVLSKLN